MNINNLPSEPTLAEKSKASQPKVSVVIPVYNAGKFLRPCLDTLVNQTLRDIEFICILDCPTDSSDKIVEEYAAKDNRFVVIRNKRNLHIGESRNVGIRAARGEYIGFSDHDDTHELVMYEKLYYQASNSSKDVVLSGTLASVLSQKRHVKSNDIVVDWAMAIFLHKALQVTTNLYKRNFLIDNNIYFDDTKQFNIEDGFFNLRVLCKIQKTDNIAIVNRYFYNRVLHDCNTSSNPEHRSSQKTVCFLSKTYDLLKNGQSRLSPDICDYGMSQLTVRGMYTQFREDFKNRGLKQSLSKIEQVFNSNAFLMDTLENTSIFISHIPPTKRAFLLLLKLRLFFNRTKQQQQHQQ